MLKNAFNKGLAEGRSFSGTLLSLLVIVLIALLFSVLGFINAIFAKRHEVISFMLLFVITPLTFLGGVFYSTSMLPTGWRWVHQVDPVFYLINLFRYAALGISDSALGASLIMVLLLIITALGLVIFLIKKDVGIRS